MEHWLGHKKSIKYLGKSKKKLESQITKHIGSTPKDPIKSVDTYNGIEDFSKKEIDYSKPFHIKQGAKDWPCVNKWDFDFFEQNYGNYQVILTDNNGLLEKGKEQEFEQIPLKQYLDECKQGTQKYLKFSRLVDENPELKEDLNLEWLRAQRQKGSFREETYMFMGLKDSLTPIHVGFSGNLFIQIDGRKKWVLYDTEDRIFLDARTKRTFYFYSDANPYELNDPNFPILKFASRYEVFLEPGDIFYVPPFMWHQVENPTDSIGLAYRFSNLAMAAKASKVLTGFTFLATKPNPLTHFLTTTFKKQAHIYVNKTQKK